MKITEEENKSECLENGNTCTATYGTSSEILSRTEICPIASELLLESGAGLLDLSTNNLNHISVQFPLGLVNSRALGFIYWLRIAMQQKQNLFAAALKYGNAILRYNCEISPSNVLPLYISHELKREWGISLNTAPLGVELQQLWCAIQTDIGLCQVFCFYMKNMESDPAHDVHHVLRVALWALQIASKKVDSRNLLASVILHDVVNLPKNHPQAKTASKLSSQVSRVFLKKIAFASDNEINTICCAIEEHSYSRGLSLVLNLVALFRMLTV